MPLLMAFRRYWAFVFFAVLTLPTIGLVLPDLPAPARTVIEPEARWWERAAERLDPWINNVFGFRGAVLVAHGTYEKWLGTTGSRRVLVGEKGQLFIKDQQALEQSVGQLVRPAMVRELADVAAMLDAEMRRLGGTFVMAVPPNGATINHELLPAYARNGRTSPTEYDLLRDQMKARGLTFVDVRPVIQAGKSAGPVQFLLDSHWNHRGSLLAYNAVMKAAGRPDLTVDPAEAIGPARPNMRGDLLRIMGSTKPDFPDVLFPLKPPYDKPQGLKPIEGVMPDADPKDPFPPHAYETGRAGPRVMLIGDSYTQNFWSGYLAQRTSAFAWMHHRNCRFDLNAVERFKPDILIFAPSERFMPCRGAPERNPPPAPATPPRVSP